MGLIQGKTMKLIGRFLKSRNIILTVMGKKNQFHSLKILFYITKKMPLNHICKNFAINFQYIFHKYMLKSFYGIIAGLAHIKGKHLEFLKMKQNRTKQKTLNKYKKTTNK